uniref:Uncharacterized protein n=1 Tax=Arundo donax TaxID=35708 RepID=A0A0A9AXU4_ARUDO
MLARPRGGLL